MGEKHERLMAEIRRLLAETPLDDLIKHGIAARLPQDLRVTPFRVGQLLARIRKEEASGDQAQASDPGPALSPLALPRNERRKHQAQSSEGSSPTAAEISQALDFHCTPPLTLAPGQETDWDIIKRHIQASEGE